MKKLLVCLFGLLFTVVAFATSIDSGATSADCDNATLGQYNGTANLEMDWQPNTINIRWYDGENQLTVQNVAQSCTYGGDLNLPTAPTKKGYTFDGWTIDKTCGLKNVDPGIGSGIYASRNSDGSVSCYGQGCSNYNPTENERWAVIFNYGTVVGESLCSSTYGNDAHIGTPDVNSTGNYCWCRITGFLWPEGGLCSTVSGWMAEYPNSSRTCADYCATTCAYRVFQYDYRRQTLYNSLPR